MQPTGCHCPVVALAVNPMTLKWIQMLTSHRHYVQSSQLSPDHSERFGKYPASHPYMRATSAYECTQSAASLSYPGSQTHLDSFRNQLCQLLDLYAKFLRFTSIYRFPSSLHTTANPFALDSFQIRRHAFRHT